VRQQENERAAAARPEPVAPFDALRVEQFVELQHDLLLVSGDPETLPERLVQRTALFLGVAGAAVGVLQDGLYTVLATYGLGPEYRARYDRQSRSAAAGRWCWTTPTAARRCAASCCPSAGRT